MADFAGRVSQLDRLRNKVNMKWKWLQPNGSESIPLNWDNPVAEEI